MFSAMKNAAAAAAVSLATKSSQMLKSQALNSKLVDTKSSGTDKLAAQQFKQQGPHQGHQSFRSVFSQASNMGTAGFPQGLSQSSNSENREITTLANRKMTPPSARTPTPATDKPILHTFFYNLDEFQKDNPGYIDQSKILDQKYDKQTNVHTVLLRDHSDSNKPGEVLAFNVDATNTSHLTSAVMATQELTKQSYADILDIALVKNLVVDDNSPENNVMAHIRAFGVLNQTSADFNLSTPTLGIFSHSKNPKIPMDALKSEAEASGISVNASQAGTPYPDIHEQFKDMSVTSYLGDTDNEKSFSHRTNFTTFSED